MKPKYNSFLTYWPWLLPIGIVIGTVGYFAAPTDYWSGFALGMGTFLAIVGLGMLIARIWHSRAKK